MKTNQILKTGLLATVIVFTSCNKDNDTPESINESEVFGGMELHLVNQADATDEVEIHFEDANENQIVESEEIHVEGTFKKDVIYTGNIEFSGLAHNHEEEEKKTSAISDKTAHADEPHDTHDEEENELMEEIEAEKDVHEVFYTLSNSIITITKTDKDNNNHPVGLKTTFTPTATGSTDLTITLKHEPKKPNNGTLEDAGGSTDFTLTVNLTVE